MSELEGDGRWLAVEQLAASSEFRRSPRLRELLLFIAKHSLLGQDNQLTEFEIARHVFGRGLNYVPTEDSIVRSSARQLRWKLKEASASADFNAAWSIDIPKGRYVAHFQLRENASGRPAEAPMEEQVIAKRPRVWAIALLAALLAISAAINVWLFERPASTRHTERLGLAPQLVMQNPGETNLVLDDYAYVLMSPHPTLANEALLNNYANRAYIGRSAAPSQDAAFLRLWDLLGTRYIVSFGAAATSDRIVRSVPQQDKIVLRHARNLVARDFQRGNYILFGSTPNDPWTALFEDELNFRFVREANGAATFLNMAPAKGEPAMFRVPQQASFNSGPGYARIVYLPNLSHSGFILMVTGLNMVTAEAAGDYAANPANAGEFLRMFGVRRVADLPHFEVLLRTFAVDNTPKDVSVVAYRKIGK
jgi:hypothetical protein